MRSALVYGRCDKCGDSGGDCMCEEEEPAAETTARLNSLAEKLEALVVSLGAQSQRLDALEVSLKEVISAAQENKESAGLIAEDAHYHAGHHEGIDYGGVRE